MSEITRGTVVRAPRREFGDDVNLTGVVQSVRKGIANVRWNGDGDITPEGEESNLPVDTLVVTSTFTD